MFRAVRPVSVRRFGFAIACVAATACSNKLPDSEVAARVNDQPITKKEFDETAERNLGRYRNQGHALQPNIEARIRESVLRRMIEDKIIDIEAKKDQVAVTDGELDAKLAEQKQRFHSDDNFKEYLQRSQTTEVQMKDELRRNMLRDRVVEKLSGEIVVTDDEVKKFYDENINRFKDREQIKAGRILVRVVPTATDAERKKAKATAQQLAKDAKKPGADFGKLARDKSNGPEASKDGDLGWLYRGRMPPEFDNVAFTMKPGEISEPIETKSGYEIIKVDERKDERVRPVEEVSDTIRTTQLARKRNDKRREVLRDLKANAKVEQLMKFDVPPGTPPGGLDPTAPRLPGAPGVPTRAIEPMETELHHGHGDGHAAPMPVPPDGALPTAPSGAPADSAPAPAQPAPAPGPTAPAPGEAH